MDRASPTWGDAPGYDGYGLRPRNSALTSAKVCNFKKRKRGTNRFPRLRFGLRWDERLLAFSSNDPTTGKCRTLQNTKGRGFRFRKGRGQNQTSWGSRRQ